MELEDFINARNILGDVIKETSLIKTDLSQKHHIYLKPENNQITGSFKIRGAYYKISTLSDEEKRRGVIACSSGNHAQGVAFACKKLGIKAHICMPKRTPQVKIENTRKYGAEVILVDGVYDDAYQKALELQREYGYTLVHPYEDIKIITGQGTISFEILEELADTDLIICPIGGGGLISGVAIAAKLINPNVKILGVEPTSALGMYISEAKGMKVELTKVDTIADGVAVKSVGALDFQYVDKYVDDIFSVTESDIIEAIKYAYTKYNLVVEGAGALSLAAAMKYKFDENETPKNVVCILSGGNIDKNLLEKIINGERLWKKK